MSQLMKISDILKIFWRKLTMHLHCHQRKKKVMLIPMVLKLPTLLVILQKKKLSLPSSNSDDAEELFIKESSKDLHKPKTISDQNALKPKISSTRSFLPGGYNPKHREPSYSNADRASWWELMVLSTHVHPSVATMAATLLSGTNIVYNENPLNDLSLTAFLDKFMEKKPKASSWHGGSQIEPAKKLDISNHLIGQELLSLAETDVLPEDLVFHKFYVNKMNSSKKPKKKKNKKKGAEEDAAEELFDVGGNDMDDNYVDGGDESDNEEIENVLESANPSLDADGTMIMMI